MPLTDTLTIGNNVKTIGDFAFYDCSSLTGNLIIPNSITSIGNSAFSRCSGLNHITISNSITSIGSETFSGCTKLTSLTIPNSVSSIGTDAFKNCTNLIEINCKNPIPPQAQSTTFSGVDKEKCTLFVPIGCTYLYKLHFVWEEFFIQEKDFSSSSIINTIKSDNDISAYITTDGVKINGCNPLDNISIYSINGQIIYNSITGDGLIKYPFEKGKIYIIHTPKKTLKVIY